MVIQHPSCRNCISYQLPPTELQLCLAFSTGGKQRSHHPKQLSMIVLLTSAPQLVSLPVVCLAEREALLQQLGP